jgi:Cu(I)/Ag(I) efflux system membrane fusion protein
MDPDFRKDGPGKSPMGMDLIPVYEGEEPSGNPEQVTLSAAEVNTIGVRRAVARIEEISRRIETVGFVDYDEHATSHIHTRVEGWIERLELRAVGDEVAEGDLLFDLYAPEITIASSELMRATQAGNAAEIAIARTKLMNFGVSARQIEEMATDDRPAQRIRFRAALCRVLSTTATAPVNENSRPTGISLPCARARPAVVSSEGADSAPAAPTAPTPQRKSRRFIKLSPPLVASIR